MAAEISKRKRGADDGDREHRAVKRIRTHPKHNLLEISDEVLLRILSYLPTSDLLRAERWVFQNCCCIYQLLISPSVSRRMRALAADGGIWKAKYSDTFARPRLVPSIPTQRDGPVDWKGRFKTRTNWLNGKATFRELEVASPPTPSILAKVHNGTIFTVDRSGLRAWSQKDGTRRLKAEFLLDATPKVTCIAAETVGKDDHVLLGFEDGSLLVYSYTAEAQFELLSNHRSADGLLLAASLASPYIMTASQNKFLAIYRRDARSAPGTDRSAVLLMVRLQFGSSFSPVSVFLRRTPGRIVAAAAYAFERLYSGWCLGLQEIQLTDMGDLVESRLASTLERPRNRKTTRQEKWNMSTRSTSSTRLPLHPQMMSPPTSLSYQHPYLIGTLADNTMMMYLVTSSSAKLEISAGRRLWGHTSAISRAEVNSRGKAVSISSRGNEMRIWELENVMMGTQQRTSIEIQPVNRCNSGARRGSSLEIASVEAGRELDQIRRWVGFDDEQVVVLSETEDQRQIMAMYDFT